MKNKKLTMFIWWAFWFIFLEMIFRIFVVGNFFSLSTLSVILFSIPFVIVISIILNLYGEKFNKVLNIIFTTFFGFLMLAQFVYYKVYDSVFSFFSITAGGAGQVMQFWEQIVKVVTKNWFVILITIVPYILFLIFNKKIFTYKKVRSVTLIGELILLVLSLIGVACRIYFDNKGIYSLKRLVFETHAPMLTIEKTGLTTMEVIDLYRYVFGFEEEIYFDEEEDNKEEVVLDKEKEYNVYDIDFDSLIKRQKSIKYA